MSKFKVGQHVRYENAEPDRRNRIVFEIVEGPGYEAYRLFGMYELVAEKELISMEE